MDTARDKGQGTRDEKIRTARDKGQGTRDKEIRTARV
jgi:hypothetical protein